MHASKIALYHDLIEHLRSIVGRRDRNSLNQALVLTVGSIFGAAQTTLLRIVHHCGTNYAIPCVVRSADAETFRDVYLAAPQDGYPLDSREDYATCCRAGAPMSIERDEIGIHLFPLEHRDEVHALLELQRDRPLDANEMHLMEDLLGLFLDHLALIDYAESDTLTGLLNRKTFDENLSRMLAHAGNDAVGEASQDRRHLKPGDVSNWLAMVDIDHFKRINDEHGHIIGDEVLLLIAQAMRRAFRFNDQLFRFGGEEFVSVLQLTDRDDARHVLERFRKHIEASVFPIVGRVTISIGFTRVDELDTPTELVGRADQALYFAKRNGRNRVECYEDLVASGQYVVAHPARPAVELF
ncbi:GGDEF domain-containing protein [Propionivibrio dicarboxylicus]|uniref:diguanylate cyclase n=1 Tax=Propionivibrio dicarboxylicus TaxID=83767 RepID=A0A1G8HZ88_9RHOO|nr:GGDEF domain-containing protein [Propionivibrio dicarboxylicus]SDI11999.1 diguanylate cyclase (GGDEF) domain-containing protein [Propionivibrio dicarboxylicus]